MQPKISIQNVYYAYADETEVLRNVSLDILPNEVFVLFGPSRSGKSTLLRLLNRLSDLLVGGRFQGTILFNGQNIFERSVNVFDLRRRVSMVFAVPTPLPGSIRDNLTYGLKMAGLRGQAPLVAYLFFRLAMPIIIALIALVYLFLIAAYEYPPLIKIGLALVAGYLGFYLPNMLVENLVQRRQTSIKNAFPGAETARRVTRAPRRWGRGRGRRRRRRGRRGRRAGGRRGRRPVPRDRGP